MENLNITSAQYVAAYDHNGDLVSAQSVINIVVDGNTMTVPLDPTNRHYAEILRQVEAGKLTIQDAD